MRPRSTLIRAVLSLCAGGAGAYCAALGLGLADVYLAGHGAGALGGPVFDVPEAGIHLTLADALVLIAGLLAAGVTWTELRGHGA